MFENLRTWKLRVLADFASTYEWNYDFLKFWNENIRAKFTSMLLWPFLLNPWPIGVTTRLARSSKGKSENFCSVLCCCALCQWFLHLCIRIARLYGREGIVELCAYVNGHIYKDLSRGTHFAIAIIISLLFWEKNQPHFARNKHKAMKISWT
jgi:hypothetical protein